MYSVIYIILPANPVSRRRQHRHLSLSKFASCADETRFFQFLSWKMCVSTCGHQWLWARPFCVAGAVFCEGEKMPCAFSLAGARNFAFFAVWQVFFFAVLSFSLDDMFILRGRRSDLWWLEKEHCHFSTRAIFACLEWSCFVCLWEVVGWGGVGGAY